MEHIVYSVLIILFIVGLPLAGYEIYERVQKKRRKEAERLDTLGRIDTVKPAPTIRTMSRESTGTHQVYPATISRTRRAVDTETSPVQAVVLGEALSDRGYFSDPEPSFRAATEPNWGGGESGGAGSGNFWTPSPSNPCDTNTSVSDSGCPSCDSGGGSCD